MSRAVSVAGVERWQRLAPCLANMQVHIHSLAWIRPPSRIAAGVKARVPQFVLSWLLLCSGQDAPPMSREASSAPRTSFGARMSEHAIAARAAAHPIDPQFLQRWSPRAFTGEAIDEATLLTFLEAARWAPSGFNAQPWRFIYARAGTPAWEPLLGTLSEFNRGWAHRASALVLVLSARQWLPPGKTEPLPPEVPVPGMPGPEDVPPQPSHPGGPPSPTA